MSPSNIAGRRAGTIGCRRWRPNWSVVQWRHRLDWGHVVARAAKAATSTIPIVFAIGDDPVKSGLVASLNRPGGNVTGIMLWLACSAPNGSAYCKSLCQLRAERHARDPNNPNAESQLSTIVGGGTGAGLAHHVVMVATERDIDTAFAILIREQAGALIVGTDPFFITQLDQLVSLAAHHAVPTVYFLRESQWPAAWMRYRTSLVDANRQLGISRGRTP